MGWSKLLQEEVHVQYEQQQEFQNFKIPKFQNLAHHHGTELIKVHGAWAIFIDLFNDAVQVLRGQPVNENDKLVSKSLCTLKILGFLDLKSYSKRKNLGT